MSDTPPIKPLAAAPTRRSFSGKITNEQALAIFASVIAPLGDFPSDFSPARVSVTKLPGNNGHAITVSE